jgi:hypothetical protein
MGLSTTPADSDRKDIMIDTHMYVAVHYNGTTGCTVTPAKATDVKDDQLWLL